jgi:hypothetical protein
VSRVGEMDDDRRPVPEASLGRVVLVSLAVALTVLVVVALSGSIPVLGSFFAAVPVVPIALIVVTLVVLVTALRRR